MTITRNQWIAITILALGLISGATGQMTDIFGSGPAKSIASAASFLSSFVAGIQVILGGQGQQIKDVAAMPGIDPIKINANASEAAAKVALDPAVDKVAPAIGAEQAVQTIAKGT